MRTQHHVDTIIQVDTAQIKKSHRSIFQQMYASLNKQRKAPAIDTENVQSNNITDFGFRKSHLSFNGKTIRHINIIRLNFDRNLDDTAARKSYWGSRLMSNLHNTTKEYIIRQNLFLKQNTPFSAILAADNERYLRSLPYLRDARILVDSIPGCKDSIDVLVYTKDLFSILLNISRISGDNQRISLSEVNLFGIGQRISLGMYHSNNRQPAVGNEFLYEKKNLWGTYVDVLADYTTYASNNFNGLRNERYRLLDFKLPLVSQFRKVAGDLTLKTGQTINYFNQSDSDFNRSRYKYYLLDGWLGINIGSRKLLESKIVPRQFVSLRYFQYRFPYRPIQLGDNIYNLKFDDRRAILGQYTIFKQDFYKTNYLYGFGLTEDIPFGYNVSLIGGWYQQRTTNRPYFGFDANKYYVSKSGNIMQLFSRFGAYYGKRGVEDINALLGISLYSKLLIAGNWKIRMLSRASYSEIFNHFISDPLQINNQEFGLDRFGIDSTVGRKRITLQNQTFFFSPWRILNFQIAPFTNLENTLLTPMRDDYLKIANYAGIGGGVRIRNDNFVFGTTEVKFIYFPKDVPNLNKFKLNIKANLRFRFNTNYVKAPDIAQMNSDPYDMIH